MTRKNSGSLLILFLVVALLSFSAVSADIEIQKYSLSYDFFSGAINAEPSVCACSSYIDKISITNTGSFGAVFTINTNIPEYAKVPFPQVTLEPGESAVVDIIIEAPCNLEKNLDYDVTIESNLNREQVISRTLEIKKCQTIQASLFTDKDSILPCEPLDYTIQINNPSTFTETYSVEPINFPEYFDEQRYEVTVSPFQKGIVETTLGLSCDIYGNKTVGFRITSLNNDLVADVSHALNIQEEYDFSANIPEEINACEDLTSEFEISISNEERFENTYYLSLEGQPDFVWLDQESIVVDGENEGPFKVVVSPLSETSGTYSFILRIESDFGNDVVEKNVTLYINTCFNLYLEIMSDDNPELCADDYVFDVLVRNDGSFEETAYLNLNGDYSYLSRESVVLQPGEEQTVSMHVNAAGELDGNTLPLEVTASLKDRQTTKVWSDTIEPKIFSQYSCTYVVPLKAKIYVPYSGNETHVGIENKGVVEATYNLELNGPDNAELETEYISVMPGETGFVKINTQYDEEPRNNYYNFTITSVNNDVSYEYQLQIVRTKGLVVEKIWDFFKVSVCKIVTLILLILFLIAIILFIVRVSKKGSSWDDMWRYRVILSVLAVLAIIAVFVLFGFPQAVTPLPDNSNPLVIQWNEGDTKTIDLNDYFSDPDNDVLFYGISDEPDNITVLITDNEVKFVPDEDWFGNRRVRFTAEDSAGEFVVGERMTLEVIEDANLSFAEWYTRYCAYVNLILIILILFVLFFVPWGSRQNEEGKVKVVGVEKEKGYVYYVDKDGDVSKRKAPERKPAKKKKKRK